MKMIEYLYIGMVCISAVCTFIAFNFYNTTQELIRNGIKTKATVIDLIKVSNDDGYQYKPVFEYKNFKNEVRSFKSEVSSKPSPYKIGDRVDIVYSEDGDKKKVVSYWGLYRWTIILLSFAAPLLIIGGGYLLYSRG